MYMNAIKLKKSNKKMKRKKSRRFNSKYISNIYSMIQLLFEHTHIEYNIVFYQINQLEIGFFLFCLVKDNIRRILRPVFYMQDSPFSGKLRQNIGKPQYFLRQFFG